MSKSLVEKVSKIQKALKAPKSQYNSFGKYAYRNQEDILEAVKPLLAEHGLIQVISDEIIEVGGRVYVKATVEVTDGESTISNSAFAREPLEQKGMNEAQITGSASSYARKYALNGMYAIDDTKDADATNDHGKGTITKEDIKESKAVVAATANKEDKPKSKFQPKGKSTPTAEPTHAVHGGPDDAPEGWS